MYITWAIGDIHIQLRTSLFLVSDGQEHVMNLFMIKIDWQAFVRRYSWFGVSYNEFTGADILVTSVRIGNSNWVYSNWWTLRLWPIRVDGTILPTWYTNIFVYFGYMDKEGNKK